jgi:hypothetical protein
MQINFNGDFRMNRLASALVVGSSLVTAAAARGEIVELQYRPVPGVSLQYGSMGYTPDDGEYTPLTGFDVVSSRAYFKFTPDDGIDMSTFVAAMAVPVAADEQFYYIDGASMTQTSPGVWEGSIAANNLYNGTILASRFAVDCYAVDPTTGKPVFIGGTFSDDSGFFFSVEIPEPLGATFFAVGGLMMRRRRG